MKDIDSFLIVLGLTGVFQSVQAMIVSVNTDAMLQSLQGFRFGKYDVTVSKGEHYIVK